MAYILYFFLLSTFNTFSSGIADEVQMTVSCQYQTQEFSLFNYTNRSSIKQQQRSAWTLRRWQKCTQTVIVCENLNPFKIVLGRL